MEPGAFWILLRNHCSPPIATASAAITIIGLVCFTTHLLNPAMLPWIAAIAGLVLSICENQPLLKAVPGYSYVTSCSGVGSPDSFMFSSC